MIKRFAIGALALHGVLVDAEYTEKELYGMNYREVRRCAKELGVPLSFCVNKAKVVQAILAHQPVGTGASLDKKKRVVPPPPPSSAPPSTMSWRPTPPRNNTRSKIPGPPKMIPGPPLKKRIPGPPKMIPGPPLKKRIPGPPKSIPGPPLKKRIPGPPKSIPGPPRSPANRTEKILVSTRPMARLFRAESDISTSFKSSGAEHDGTVTLATQHGFKVIRTKNVAKKRCPAGYLGCGEAGVVWDAIDSNGEKCVIKVNRPQGGSKVKAYGDIKREGDWLHKLGELQIRNIAGLKAMFHNGESVELVLEKVGELDRDRQELMDIGRLKRGTDPIPLIRQIAGVLTTLHVNSIAHMDMHLGNVMILQSKDVSKAFVIDWSRARDYTEYLEQGGRMLKNSRNADGRCFATAVKKLFSADPENRGKKIKELVENTSIMKMFPLIFKLSDVHCFAYNGENWIPVKRPQGEPRMTFGNEDFQGLPGVRKAEFPNGEERLIIVDQV